MYLTAMFLWLSLKFFFFFVCLFSLCSNTHMLTHTVRCSKLTRQLSLLKVLKLSNTQVSEEERERKREGEGKNWLRMAEAYGNRKKKKSTLECVLRKVSEKQLRGYFIWKRSQGRPSDRERLEIQTSKTGKKLVKCYIHLLLTAVL